MKKLITAVICLILVFNSVLSFAACGSAPSISAARAEIEALLPGAKTLMELLYGGKMPVVEVTEATEHYVYREVTVGSPYKKIEEIKAAMEDVYSKNARSMMYEYLFEGIDDGTTKRSKFSESTNKILTVNVTETPWDLKYEIVLDGARLVRGNRIRAVVSAKYRTEHGGTLYDFEITIVKEKDAHGNMSWRLDSYVW